MLAAILEQGVPIDALDGNNKSFLTYESNVLFALRFMVDTDIVGGNWVRYPAMSLLSNAHAAGTVLYKIDDAQASCRAVAPQMRQMRTQVVPSSSQAPLLSLPSTATSLAVWNLRTLHPQLSIFTLSILFSADMQNRRCSCRQASASKWTQPALIYMVLGLSGSSKKDPAGAVNRSNIHNCRCSCQRASTSTWTRQGPRTSGSRTARWRRTCTGPTS